MHENEVSEKIIGTAIKVHAFFGPGLFESVYEKALAFELVKEGLFVEVQKKNPVTYCDILIDEGFCVDLMVNNSVVLELKSVRSIDSVHLKQVLTYIKLARKKLGLLINFNEVLLRDGIRRVVNGI